MNLLNFMLEMKLIQILKKFLDTKCSIGKIFFQKIKMNLKISRKRLTLKRVTNLEFQLTDFKRLVSRVQKGEKSLELQKKKWSKLI